MADSNSAQPAKRVLTGLSWADSTPQVRIRDDEAPASTLRPVVGLRLRYRTSPDAARLCVGHTPFRKSDVDHVDCAAAPLPGGRKCDRCAVVDSTFASNLHHAHTKDRADIDPAIAEHLRQPNRLYIAAFRDGSLKVGTTTEKRREKRLTEQGAWRAMFVATTTDGYAVRDIEDKVTAELGLAQSVSIGRKLDGMAQPKLDSAIESSLESASGLVAELIGAAGDARLTPMSEPWQFPDSDSHVWAGLHRYPLKLSSGSHDLEVQAACGRMMVLAQPGSSDAFVADLGQLFGIELDIGDYEPDALAVQDSLF